MSQQAHSTKSMKKIITLFFVMMNVSLVHAQLLPAVPHELKDTKQQKEWYEFVFFSPLVSGIVVSGIIGWFLLIKGERIRTNNIVINEQKKRHFDSLKAYQEEARLLQAPALETYNRTCKMQIEAPRIEDNKLLIEYLSYVLESYSRFRVAYTEAFRVSTQRYCPAVAEAFEYISDDFCNIMIYISSDLDMRRSAARQEQIKIGVERLKYNIDCIESNLARLTVESSDAT